MHELQPSQIPLRVKLSKCRLKIRKSFLAGRYAEQRSGKQCRLRHAAVSSPCTGTAAAERAVRGSLNPAMLSAPALLGFKELCKYTRVSACRKSEFLLLGGAERNLEVSRSLI